MDQFVAAKASIYGGVSFGVMGLSDCEARHYFDDGPKCRPDVIFSEFISF
jgi:hypothetical protein